MKLYNTLTRTVQEFHPLDGKTVRMYVCGPTVYDDPHIGHARSAYIFDVLRRYLEFKGFQVRFVRNVTDVDDKIIEKARQETRDTRQETGDLSEVCREVAERYLKSYHDTLERLGIGHPTQEPAATAHIDDMVNLISQLVVNGSAYETKTGDVYFAVHKFPAYGQLSKQSVDELQAGARVEPNEHKQDPLDFALWKAAKPGEPSWNSPWGAGRPGWHIECSAMSTKYLGDEFDIHGGGVDLVFPHHENEVAQAQAAGKPFARFWVHNGLLTVNGEKMSKSLGNFITVQDALKQCRGQPDVLKEFFLNAHYRSPLDYSDSSIRMSFERLNGLLTLIGRAEELERKGLASREIVSSMPPPKELSGLEDQFESAMDDDLNTPEALAVLDKIVRQAWGRLRQSNPWESLQPIQFKRLSEKFNKILYADQMLRRLGKILGLFEQYEALVPTPQQQEKIEEREAARKRKDFQTADRIRSEFQAVGLILEDTEQGPVIRRKL